MSTNPKRKTNAWSERCLSMTGGTSCPVLRFRSCRLSRAPTLAGWSFWVKTRLPNEPQPGGPTDSGRKRPSFGWWGASPDRPTLPLGAATRGMPHGDLGTFGRPGGRVRDAAHNPRIRWGTRHNRLQDFGGCTVPDARVSAVGYVCSKTYFRRVRRSKPVGALLPTRACRRGIVLGCRGSRQAQQDVR